VKFAGQIHLDGGAFSVLARNAQRAAMQMDDLARDGQAQPKAALAVSGVFGREIRGENALEVFRADAFAVVRDFEPVPARLLSVLGSGAS